MIEINPKIFKKYDIRGKAQGADAPVNPNMARLIGHAFGSYVQQIEGKQTVVVGRDNRLSSPELAAAAIDGLQKSGCSVFDIGLVSTPLVYWHAVHRDQAGGLMVTGSHLAPDQNGFKLSIGHRNLYGDQIVRLRRMIEENRLINGSGTVEADESAVQRYMDDLAGRIRPARPLKVVIDAGNGTGGLFAPALFTRWGNEVVDCLYCEPDGNYPHHQPDPQEPENLRALAARVTELSADIGIAFDGDADRMGAVDERGHIIVADRILALLAQDMLKRHRGAVVVADVLSSQALFDAVAAAGGRPEMWISGHSLIKARMAERGALLGGEMSGHIFLAEDYFGFDDAFLSAGRLLQLLASSSQPLSQLDAAIPIYYSTPEYRPRCPDDMKAVVIEGVKQALAGTGDVIAVDGIRIQFEKGWGILRASNTEPVLSLRFEGETEADALWYRDMFFSALKAFPQVELKPD